MRALAQIFVAAKFTTPYRPEAGRSIPMYPQMSEIESTADLIEANDPWHSSDAVFDLARTAVTDEDWNAMGVTEEDLAGMTPSIDQVLAMTDADWIGLRLSQSDLIRLREDLMRRLGVRAQDLTWLSRAIEGRQYGHTRSKTDANRTQAT